jgi:hypothetical protein
MLQRAKLFVNIVFLVDHYIFVYKSKKQPCSYKVLDASMVCALQKKQQICAPEALLGAIQFGVAG